MRLVLGFALASAVAGAANAQESAAIALVGGEVRTAAGPSLRSATVVLRGGRVEAVGADVPVPPGARRIDVTGCVVTPGLIDADGALPLPESERHGGKWGVDFRAADAVDRFDARHATARSQGVTAYLVTGEARGNFAGRAALVLASSPAETLEPQGPLVVTLATPDFAGGAWGAQRYAEVRSTFVEARERRESIERWRRDVQAAESGRASEPLLAVERLLLPPELLDAMRAWPLERRFAWREAALKSAGREKDWTKPKVAPRAGGRPGADPALDLVLTAMGGDAPRPVLVRAQTETDVRSALALANEFSLRVVVAGGEGLAAAAAELVRAKTPVVLSDAADTEHRAAGPLAERRSGLAARLVAAGLRPALASGGSGGGARFLRLYAAQAIAEGLSEDDALRCVTLWAAEAAGVADRMGSIAPGRRADLVVWTGDPFAATSRARLVVLGGRVVEEAR